MCAVRAGDSSWPTGYEQVSRLKQSPIEDTTQTPGDIQILPTPAASVSCPVCVPQTTSIPLPWRRRLFPPVVCEYEGRGVDSALKSEQSSTTPGSIGTIAFLLVILLAVAVACSPGVDVAANQDFDEERGESDLETFQMEIDKESGKWSVRTNNDKFWTLKTGGNSGIQATGSQSASPDAQFEIHWLGRQIAFQASNGRFVATKLNGQLAATADDISDACKFTFKLVNRPLLVLRGPHGFVAVGKGDRLECHHADYGIFEMINNDGAYQLKGQDGKFWKMEGENNVAMSTEGGTDFLIELREHSKFCIRAPNDKYLRGEQNGQFRATGTEVNKETLWEY
ncbi:Fascin [Branchiostoma belcheri]|nr:Fascin [Branchiostoma belcheri]